MPQVCLFRGQRAMLVGIQIIIYLTLTMCLDQAPTSQRVVQKHKLHFIIKQIVLVLQILLVVLLLVVVVVVVVVE